MSLVESLHQARKARLQRIAARAVPDADPESASKPALVRVRAPDRDYERAWAFEILGVGYIRPRKPRVEDIQRAVAQHFGVAREDLQSMERARVPSRARHVAMYLARELTAKSFPEIGRCFGRDHATVHHAVRGIEDLLAQDADFAAAVDHIREMLNE